MEKPGRRLAAIIVIGAEMALGRTAEAAAEAAQIVKDRPDFSLAKFARTQPFRDKARRSRYLEALREAGLPT